MPTDPVLPPGFDPGGAASGDGIFGLPVSPDQAKVVIVPVPFDATTSYSAGTARGPAAVFEASFQVDLFDPETGKPYEQGIAMLPVPEDIAAWNAEARALAEPILAAGGAGTDPRLQERLARVNEICGRLNDRVHGQVAHLLDQGKMPVVLGGDHAVPFGAFRAYAEKFPGLGILHFDAHYDLRPAYEGFQWSHASIMNNALERVPGIARIVHVGIRDFSEEEHRISRDSGGRSIPYLEHTLRDRMDQGETWRTIVDEIAGRLPPKVYVSFDIDGLDPALCPGTGTPVPGGLSFHEATSLIAAVVRRGRRIVGCDLCEVAPSPGDSEWNANVGARLLYKMIGYALKSQGSRLEA